VARPQLDASKNTPSAASPSSLEQISHASSNGGKDEIDLALGLGLALLATACGDTNKGSGGQDVTTTQDLTTQDATSGFDADSQEQRDLDLTPDGVKNTGMPIGVTMESR